MKSLLLLYLKEKKFSIIEIEKWRNQRISVKRNIMKNKNMQIFILMYHLLINYYFNNYLNLILTKWYNINLLNYLKLLVY